MITFFTLYYFIVGVLIIVHSRNVKHKVIFKCQPKVTRNCTNSQKIKLKLAFDILQSQSFLMPQIKLKIQRQSVIYNAHLQNFSSQLSFLVYFYTALHWSNC